MTYPQKKGTPTTTKTLYYIKRKKKKNLLTKQKKYESFKSGGEKMRKILIKILGIESYIKMLKNQIGAKDAQIRNLKNRLKFYERI